MGVSPSSAQDHQWGLSVQCKGVKDPQASLALFGASKATSGVTCGILWYQEVNQGQPGMCSNYTISRPQISCSFALKSNTFLINDSLVTYIDAVLSTVRKPVFSMWIFLYPWRGYMIDQEI